MFEKCKAHNHEFQKSMILGDFDQPTCDRMKDHAGPHRDKNFVGTWTNPDDAVVEIRTGALMV